MSRQTVDKYRGLLGMRVRLICDGREGVLKEVLALPEVHLNFFSECRRVTLWAYIRLDGGPEVQVLIDDFRFLNCGHQKLANREGRKFCAECHVLISVPELAG